MKKKTVGWYVAVMLVIAGVGLMHYTENVRTVQIIGLFASGAVFGVSIAMIFAAFGAKKNQP